MKQELTKRSKHFSHRQLSAEVANWQTSSMNVWTYYVHIPERLLSAEQFKALWLAPEVIKITPESRGFVTYDYYSAPIGQLDSWHGGVTFYKKHGAVEGFRSVEFGCDYNHLDDQGHAYDFETVTRDALRTADEIADLYNLQ